MNAVDATSPETLALLRDGEISACTPILHGWNSTLLVEITHGERRCGAVYKPMRGESPLWDFPPNTLYRRECLAYEVSRALGWDLVPPTVERDGPYGLGSAQLFIQAEPDRHYFNLLDEHREALLRMAVFDCLINNVDRKGGHVLLDTSGRVWSIDHGLSFLPERKMRTVMWDLSDDPIDEAVNGAIGRMCHDAELHSALEANLTDREVQAFYRRAERAADSATVPMEAFADAWRPYPWPAI